MGPAPYSITVEHIQSQGRGNQVGNDCIIYFTGVYEIAGVCGWREHEDSVVDRDWTDEVEDEERLQVMPRYLAGLEDDLISEVADDNTCDGLTSDKKHPSPD